MTRGRPARSDEIPRYGSVWVWRGSLNSNGIERVALRVDGRHLVSMVVASDDARLGAVDDDMVWLMWGDNVMKGWYCIDEGPE